jgi:hypothetical protein
MFDVPISRCEAIHEMVVIDQTQAECAREHECPADRVCPLDGYFNEASGISPETLREAALRLPN